MAKFGPMVESCSTLPSFFGFSFLPKCKIGTLPCFWFCRFTRMSFLPENLTPAFCSLWYARANCSRGDTSQENISHSDGHSILGCRTGWMFFRKTKRADYTEHQESAGAWLSLQNAVLCNRLWKIKVGFCFLPAPANRTKGVVEQFGIFVAYRCCVGLLRLLYYGSNIFIQLLCSGVPLCHYYTDNVLCRQGCKTLSLYSEFQKANFNGCRKLLSTC